MNNFSLIKATPWDSAVFGMPTWEVIEYSESALQETLSTAGHFTLKVDPLSDKCLLHKYGFYYCDTLIEPYCTAERLRFLQHPDASISKQIIADEVIAICHGAFKHGRFHRDFNLPLPAANLRYDNWLKQLIDGDQVFGLYWQGALSGFIGYSGNGLVLHAIDEKQRGKGLSKFWWSAVCNELFAAGHVEVHSSISASNLAVFNLYASLGFSFKNSQDIYHRVNVSA